MPHWLEFSVKHSSLSNYLQMLHWYYYSVVTTELVLQPAWNHLQKFIQDRMQYPMSQIIIITIRHRILISNRKNCNYRSRKLLCDRNVTFCTRVDIRYVITNAYFGDNWLRVSVLQQVRYSLFHWIIPWPLSVRMWQQEIPSLAMTNQNQQHILDFWTVHWLA